MTIYLISEHEGARDWLEDAGIVVDARMTIFAPWIVAPGDVVIGTLSNETAATIHQRLGTYLHLELNLPADALNTELTADTLRECGARLNYFELTASNMKNCLRPLQIKC